MPDSLVDFVQSRKDKFAHAGPDWPAKREEWIRSVEGLYQQIQTLLAEPIAGGDVATRTFDIEATEELLGAYKIPALELTFFGAEHVNLLPKSLTVIGAAGRVDMRGQLDTVALLKDVHEQDGWSVLLQRTPHLKTTPLNSEALTYALKRVMLP